jgi:WD40 repeat protein
MQSMPIRIFLILFLLVLIYPSTLQAAEPPQDPILRLDPSMHTAMIRRMSMDTAGRLLATASDDKTVRLWEYENGQLRLLRVLRPPLGEGNEGKIYAVAISPDGATVAAGGNTGWAWEGKCLIYLFNSRTGALTGRITGLPEVILHLSFSPDGRFLATSLLGKNGIRLFRTTDLAEVGKDADYGSDSYGSTFFAAANSGLRLATTSWDGNLRLYDVATNGSLTLRAKVKAPGGSRPYGIAASGTGRLAVGYNDTTKVDVFSGTDLAGLFSADTQGINYVGNGLDVVAWSPDGSTLYDGGRYENNRATPVFSWTEGGRGRRQEIQTGMDNSILSLIPLPDSSLLIGSTDPAIALISGQQSQLLKSPETANFRENLEGFQVSRRGDRVRFGYQIFGKSPAVFDIANRTILPGNDDSALQSPVTSGDMRIIDWKNNYIPKLNGTPLKLNQYEPSRSMAIAPQGAWFALGSDWNLRSYNRDGTERWKIPAPGIVWAVNVTGDGSCVVAALSDGTIRWYRAHNGKEILAFYPHPDKKRWVLWTPGGYYDASPGAEELIGWHVNHGKDQAADFFAAGRFRNIYYRPDVLSRVLDALDEKEAVRLADEAAGRKKQETTVAQILPPVITILTPEDGAGVRSSTLIVRYQVRTPSGERVTGVKALVNGRPVTSKRGITIKPKESDVQELAIDVPAADCEISLIAENRYAASEPATVRLRWAGVKIQDEFVIKPRLYVLAIGISNYQNAALKLGLAAKDARDFAAAMQTQQGGIYRDVSVKVLTDAQATKDDIMDGLDWLQKETTAKDIGMLFIAGHGVNDPTGIYYFLPVNADTERLKRTGVAFSDIKNTVASLAGKTLLFVDTCHSGNVMGTRRGAADITAVVNELASAENGTVVFASSTGNQYSLEDKAWGNGAFTKALVEGIGGKADYTGKGRITINMLDLYLSERVKELTKGKQTPTTTKPQTIQDFPVAMKR